MKSTHPKHSQTQHTRHSVEHCAADIVAERRIRQKDGIDRGEELEAVLRLAEQFPAQVPQEMEHPVFG